MPAPEGTGITIYGESWCPFCQEALKLLEELKRTEGTPYKYYNIGDEADSRVKRDAVRAFLQPHGLPAEHKSVPMVFVDPSPATLAISTLLKAGESVFYEQKQCFKRLEWHNHCFMHFLASKHCLAHFWAPP